MPEVRSFSPSYCSGLVEGKFPLCSRSSRYPELCLVLPSLAFLFSIWAPGIPDLQTLTMDLPALQAPSQPPICWRWFRNRTQIPPMTLLALGVMLFGIQLPLVLSASQYIYCPSSCVTRSSCFCVWETHASPLLKQQQRTVIYALECTIMRNKGCVAQCWVWILALLVAQ